MKVDKENVHLDTVGLNDYLLWTCMDLKVEGLET